VSGHTHDTYVHGHHDSVLRSHRWRTAENSAAYLLPHLQAGMTVLDLGCGPGTVTCDLATRVAPGEVLGIDLSAAVIDEARSTAAERGVTNVTFDVADLHDVGGRYDVVHAHQVLHHLSDPIGALRTMAGLALPGGLVATRETDYPSMMWSPASDALTRWLELYLQVSHRNAALASAGRQLLSWARQAGLDDRTYTTSTWTFTGDDAAWWGDLWSRRVVASDFGGQAVEYGLSSEDELRDVSAGWQAWGAEPDATFVIVHGELLARV
jgi:2-polyprenyl-3-methyl-5-hydroxy-6-metoxy-1,4-benzoquinol methylase